MLTYGKNLFVLCVAQSVLRVHSLINSLPQAPFSLPFSAFSVSVSFSFISPFTYLTLFPILFLLYSFHSLPPLSLPLSPPFHFSHLIFPLAKLQRPGWWSVQVTVATTGPFLSSCQSELIGILSWARVQWADENRMCSPAPHNNLLKKMPANGNTETNHMPEQQNSTIKSRETSHLLKMSFSQS